MRRHVRLRRESALDNRRSIRRTTLYAFERLADQLTQIWSAVRREIARRQQGRRPVARQVQWEAA